MSIDDGSLVLGNDLVQRPLSIATLWRMFTSYDPELYVPLTFLSYHIDVVFGGLNPAFFHFHNILLHTINVLLVFWLLLQLRAGRMAAFLGAVLFAVHPINAEAVLWISARKDLLSTMFGLLAYNCFLRWNTGGSTRWYWIALVMFLCGLFAKVTVLLLPIILLVLPSGEGRTFKQKLVTLLPFGALSGIFAIIAVIGKMRTFGAAIPLQSYPLLAAKSSIATLGKIIVPTHFSPLYPQAANITIFSAEFFLPLLGVVVIGTTIFLLRRRMPVLWYGAIFFLCGFTPSFLTFTKNGEIFITSDRYAYFAFVGVAWILGTMAMQIHNTLGHRQVFLALWKTVVACIVISFCVISYAQTHVWRTDESLMRHIITLAPAHALAYNNLGAELMRAGKLTEAEAEFQKAIDRNSHFILPRINLAGLLVRRGDTGKAEDQYRAAIAAIDRTKRIRSDDITAYYFLAGILDARGDAAGALRLYQEAAVLGADIAEAQYNLAVTLQKNGKISEAETAYRRTIALDSTFVDARFNLAEILAERGLLEEALAELDAVVSLEPENALAVQHQANIRQILAR